MALALGLDLSTQSLSALLLDTEIASILYSHSIGYASDRRLAIFGLEATRPIVPPRAPGEADQPPLLFLAALEALFDDLQAAGLPLANITVLNCSAQQHGHVYLNSASDAACASLRSPGGGTLQSRFEGCFSYPLAPIWMTSNSATQAAEIRAAVGGGPAMRMLSGADSPTRYSGAIIRRVGQRHPELYRQTAHIHLLSSFLAALLTGHIDCPIDWGNGSGMSLMDYSSRSWSPSLLEAVAAGLPAEIPTETPSVAGAAVTVKTADATAQRTLSPAAEALRRRLPGLCSPQSIVGQIGAYFCSRWGLNPHCRVAAGSGDNPASKAVVRGDLLSLGSSFVIMADGAPDMADQALAMTTAFYDALANPFVFGCRTNGALVWDSIAGPNIDRSHLEDLLAQTAIGQALLLWQPNAETFPPSPAFAPHRVSIGTPYRANRQASDEQKQHVRLENGYSAADYAAAIDANLALMRHYSRSFMPENEEPLYLTGGPAQSPAIAQRVSAFWKRPVIALQSAGAALGAAIAGAAAIAANRQELLERLNQRLIAVRRPYRADSEACAAAVETEERTVELFEAIQ